MGQRKAVCTSFARVLYGRARANGVLTYVKWVQKNDAFLADSTVISLSHIVSKHCYPDPATNQLHHHRRGC